jgi:hypothetical protein
LRLVLNLLIELEDLLDSVPFEIEFALSASSAGSMDLHLLQVYQTQF